MRWRKLTWHESLAGPAHPSLKESAMNTMARFYKSEKGVAASEYAIMFALIILACVSTITLLGGSMNHLFASVAEVFTVAP